MKLRMVFTVLAVAMLCCSCIFSPDPEDGKDNPGGKVLEPTSPENVLNNLKVAFDNLDIATYRDCLNDNYYYLSRSEVDDIDIRWSKSEDLSTVERLMAGSTKFVFQATQNSIREEYGKNCPDIPDGAVVVDEHPNEMWLVINYIVDMEIFTKDHGDYRVHQYMDFNYVRDSKNHYSIILWNDLTNQ